MTIKTTAVLACATLIALAQTATAAEPVVLDDEQLDQVSAGALPDITTWDIDGGEGPGGLAGISPDRGGGGDDDGVTGVVRLRVAF